MIFKYETKMINGLRYIIGSRLISEKGVPDPGRGEYPSAFTRKLIDDRGNPLWVINAEDPMQIVEMPIQPTEEQLKTEYNNAVANRIAESFSLAAEIKLINAAIEALAKGVALPKEYLEYRARVTEINKGS